jgi:hypothetical protein
LKTVDGEQTDELGEVLNSQYQTSSVFMHDSCDFRAGESLDSCLSSARIDRSKLMHLSDDQQQKLLQLIDEFRDCFDETLGFYPYVEHIIPVDADFNLRKLREYRNPEVLKPEFQRQIGELLRNGFIRLSNSPMASSIVVVLKGPSGKDEVRLAIDSCFVNLHSQGDAFVMPHLLDPIQKCG